jgi:hypothetical protein
MKLVLHQPEEACALPESYRRALSSAVELLIVSAYLTNWNPGVGLNSKCKHFRMVVGKDFGLTRKAACQAVLAWLPPSHKVNFMVADRIDGFHPKAVFWRAEDDTVYAIIGSSNLSTAAVERNYEANVELEISTDDYAQARKWIDDIVELSVPVSNDWLKNYEEAKPPRGRKRGNSSGGPPVLVLPLPTPAGTAAEIRKRRIVLDQHRAQRENLLGLFRQCADKTISSAQFYARLSDHWGGTAGGRLTGRGFEIKGKHADFRKLSLSFLRILDTPSRDRDDVVIEEIDKLAAAKVPVRGAFLTEMLCLWFPKFYPVLNGPVRKYKAAIPFRSADGLSEGAKYLDLAYKLRAALLSHPRHPARNLAELDIVIWLAYGSADR